MRYDADHKQRSRDRVVTEAAKAIRAMGPQAISVAGVMKAAGMTHGGFYAHFESREALVAAGIEQMFKEGLAHIGAEVEKAQPPQQALANYIGWYLSRTHRDTLIAGCPLPYLAAEAPRLAGEVRARYADGAASLTASLASLLRQMGTSDPDILAGAVLAEIVGAVSLARAEPDRGRADQILAAAKTDLKSRLGLETLQ